MSRIRIKFHGNMLWLLAAAVISAMEIYAASGRGIPVSPGISPANTDGPISFTVKRRIEDVPRGSVPVGIIDGSADQRGSAILVLGNLGLQPDAELTVTLHATRESSGHAAMSANSERRTQDDQPKGDGTRAQAVALTSPLRQCRDPYRSNLHQKSDRVYFLPGSIRSPPSDREHSVIPCRLHTETPRVRIYVDQRMALNEPLTALVHAIVDAANSGLPEAVEKLVGPVGDVDHDGHLAIVLTPDVSRFGNGRTSVDGITLPADFLPGLDRPRGNNSDVIFLGTALDPGDHLRAVLAHEWCHAAVFSRRMQESAEGRPMIEDDWLNEAVAHVVEVQASGSQTNLSHRLRGFMAHPAHSPLVVRDYCRADFWRHDGCRGAAYSFLTWCLEQGDDDLLERLLDSQSLGLDGLEVATGASFERLFQGWTRSLACRLADQTRCRPTGPATQEVPPPDTVLTYRTWDLGSSSEQSITVRIGGTSAEFIRVECARDTTWRLSATASETDSLQTTLIPVHGRETTRDGE